MKFVYKVFEINPVDGSKRKICTASSWRTGNQIAEAMSKMVYNTEYAVKYKHKGKPGKVELTYVNGEWW